MSRFAGATLAATIMVMVVYSCQNGAAITAESPLLVLVNADGTMAVDVVNRPSYTVAGHIDIMHVGTTPPVAGVAAGSQGNIFVTHAGTVVSGKPGSGPDTLACNLSTSSCRSIWSGRGSSTAITLPSSSVVIPTWDSSHMTEGRLGLFNASNGDRTREVPLNGRLPGQFSTSADGRFLYWLTQAGLINDERGIFKVDLSTGKVLASATFGQELPFAVDVAPDGKVYVSMLYSVMPNQSTGNRGVPGESVQVFDPNLKAAYSIKVRPSPLLLSVSSGRLLLTHGDGTGDVDVIDPASGALVQTLHLEGSSRVRSISIVKGVSGSTEAVLIASDDLPTGSGRFRLGILDLATATVAWHQLQGSALSGASAM